MAYHSISSREGKNRFWQRPYPSSDYLDLLGRIATRNGLPTPTSQDDKVVFISRAGQRISGGDAYLEQVLGEYGATIIRPEEIPIRETLSAIYSAKKIIVSEGSAIHNFNFLGRIAADVLVLVRRKRLRLGWFDLAPRVQNLCYTEVADGSVIISDSPLPWRRVLQPSGPGAFPLIAGGGEHISDALKEFGVDVSAIWDPIRFRAQVRADFVTWIRDEVKKFPNQSLENRIRLGMATLTAINAYPEFSPVLLRTLQSAYGTTFTGTQPVLEARERIWEVGQLQRKLTRVTARRNELASEIERFKAASKPVPLYRVKSFLERLKSKTPNRNGLSTEQIHTPEAPALALLPLEVSRTQPLVVSWLPSARGGSQRRAQVQGKTPTGKLWVPKGGNVHGTGTSTIFTPTANISLFTQDYVTFRVRTWGAATNGGTDGQGASEWSLPQTVIFKD